MEPAEVEPFRMRLERELTELSVAAGVAVSALVDHRPAHADAVDAAVEETDRELALRMREHDRQKIGKVRAALKRIRDGEYGECEDCGGDIAIRRLEVNPMSLLCIDCATERDRRTH
ncbi:MAG: DnaK suppressor protein [Myxococcota bacterium]|jgi:DnaK suppressor protein